MNSEFTTTDIMLIDKEVRSKSYDDIAFLLDRSVEEITSFLDHYLKDKDIISHQQILDQKRSSRPPAVRKPKQKKKKEPLITSRLIIQDQKVARTRRNEPQFKTRQRDYSKMRTVRIDDRTLVYAELHEDPEEVRARYKKIMKKNSALKPIEKYYSKKKRA